MTVELAQLTAADFEPRLDDEFRLATEEGVIALKLVEVRRLGRALREGGAFALIPIAARTIPDASDLSAEKHRTRHCRAVLGTDGAEGGRQLLRGGVYLNFGGPTHQVVNAFVLGRF